MYLKVNALISSTTKELKPNRATKINVIIPIFYWGGHNVSWMQILFAIEFLKLDANLIFIFNDEILNKTRLSLNLNLVKRTILRLQRLNYAKKISVPSQVVNVKTGNFYEIARKKVYFNQQWEEKKTINLSEFNPDPELIIDNEKVCGLISTVLSENDIDLCVCPGGIYGNSYLWRKVCDELGVRFSSFDGDAWTMFTPDGVAAHRYDIIHAISLFKAQPDISKNSISSDFEKDVFADIYKRSLLTFSDINDYFSRYSPSNIGESELRLFIEKFRNSVVKKDFYFDNVVIFLNASWDASALDQEPWDISQSNWLDYLMEDLGSNGTSIVTLRQHPDEKFFPSTDDYLSSIAKYEKKFPNLKIHLIDASSSISSYDLILGATSVFTFTSTIGLEACILGKPTFVFKENYQVKLGALVQYKPGKISECSNEYYLNYKKLREISILCYYFGQITGYEDISILELYNHVGDPKFHKRFSEISKMILTFEKTT